MGNIESLEDRIQQTIDRLKIAEQRLNADISVAYAKRIVMTEERENLEAMLRNWMEDNQ